MKPENAHFKPLDHYLENDCESLEDVLDFARCLEDTAYPVLRSFYGWDASEEESLPDTEKMKSFPVFDPTQKDDNSIKTGWMMAELGLPYLCRFFDQKDYGSYGFTYYTGYDLDIYCDDHPVELYSYMGGHFDLGCAPDGKPHFVFLRIDSPNNKRMSLSQMSQDHCAPAAIFFQHQTDVKIFTFRARSI